MDKSTWVWFNTAEGTCVLKPAQGFVVCFSTFEINLSAMFIGFYSVKRRLVECRRNVNAFITLLTVVETKLIHTVRTWSIQVCRRST